MLGLLKYSDHFSRAQNLNQLWKKDTTTTAVVADNTGFNAGQSYLIASLIAKGTFLFRVPLKRIFGFCEDYDKILYGLKHTLTLVRKSGDDVIFRANAADAGKVAIDKIAWFMPHVLPADVEKFSIYKEIESKVSLPVAYRTRQCDTITVPQATTFAWRLGVRMLRRNPGGSLLDFKLERAVIRRKIRQSEDCRILRLI